MTQAAQNPPISAEEQAKRRESWRQANASVRIERGTISPEFLALQERHIRGEITRAQLRAEMEQDRSKARMQSRT